MKTPVLAVALVGLLAAGSARADFTLTRDTTLADSYGGQMTAHTDGSLSPEAGERDTVVTFTQFHPNRQEVFVDGEISRAYDRSDESVSRVFNGSISISNTALAAEQPGALTRIVFTDLRIERGDDGATLSGTLQVNDHSIDAAEAPLAVKRILLRLFRFLHY